MAANAFDDFIDQAWADHAAQADAVASRLAASGLGRAGTASDLQALGHLVHHVWGEHLGRYAEGGTLLRRIAADARCSGDAAAALRRWIASLDLCAGRVEALEGLAPGDRIGAQALAAANLAGRDGARAMVLFRSALDEAAAAEAATVDNADPLNRILAVASNNLACSLEEMQGRGAAERELMILAAQAARRYWERAGTWLHVERAEYRLAMTWLQAGDATQARVHAQACLDIVQAHGANALESFGAWEALALAAGAAADDDARRRALAQAEATLGGLGDEDRAACAARLAALRL